MSALPNAIATAAEPPDRLIKIGQVAEMFDVCRQTIAVWIESGRFPAPIRPNPRGQRLFSLQKIREHLARLNAAGAAHAG